jgi:NitT/TauT family transport system substrate-binding protein
VQGAYDAFGITALELQNIGILPVDVDVEELRTNSFTLFPDL